MTSAVSQNNPGLQPYDISSYTGVSGLNFYNEDKILHRIVDRLAGHYEPAHKKAMIDHLRGYGALVGGVLNDLTNESNREGKYGEIVNYDRSGNRIEEIRYCQEQVESRRISYEYGIVNLDFHPDWKYPFTELHRNALGYLCNMNGEGGVACPLAMTDGLIRILRALGTEEQKEKYLPLVAGPESTSYFMAGQYVTERVGGSNVGANRTVAEKRADGKWILNGEKWFCSNPGDLWVTTAKIQGTSTIGLFLVPRIKADGQLNGCYLLRKKDIIGSRGKVTAEAVYQDLEAEELGRPAHGLANLIKFVIRTSRVHVGLGAAGNARRAYIEALAYCRVREAYSRKIGKFPAVMRNLAEMNVLQTAIAWCVFRNFILEERKRPCEQIITPLLKYIASSQATWLTREAILLHGGNGILHDFSILPRLHNDSIINETWEGTHAIISEHVIKAAFRKKSMDDYNALIDENAAAAAKYPLLAETTALLSALRKNLAGMMQRSDSWIEMNSLNVCDALYSVFALSEMIAEAAFDIETGKNDTSQLAMHTFARALGEIFMRGRMGATVPGGVFENSESLEALI